MATQLGNAAVIWSTAEVERLWPLEAAQRTPPLHIRCCRLIHNRAQRIRTLCSFSLTRSAMTFPVLCEPQMCLLNSFCLPTSALPFPALASRNCVCTGVSAWRLARARSLLQPSPCSFWWLSVGTRTVRQNRKKDERNLDAYVRCEQTDKHKQ